MIFSGCHDRQVAKKTNRRRRSTEDDEEHRGAGQENR